MRAISEPSFLSKKWMPTLAQTGTFTERCLPFIVRCLVAALATRAAFIFLMLWVGLSDDDSHHPAAPTISARLWFSHLVVAPILETFFLQSLPIEVLRRFGCSYTTQFFAAVVPFAALHLVGGQVTAMMALASGIWFAYCYLEVRQQAVFWALGATMILHSSTNFVFPWLGHLSSAIIP